MKENEYQGYTIMENEEMDIDMSMGAYKCYCIMTRMCQDKDYCYPSLKYLAKKLRRSVRQTQRYIKELVKHNLIIIKRRGSTSNIYTVVAKIGKKVANNIKKRVDKIIKNKKNTTTGQKTPKPNERKNPLLTNGFKNKPIEGQFRNKPSYNNSKKNEFNNCMQRQYDDWDKFEKQLLGWE